MAEQSRFLSEHQEDSGVSGGLASRVLPDRVHGTAIKQSTSVVPQAVLAGVPGPVSQRSPGYQLQDRQQQAPGDTKVLSRQGKTSFLVWLLVNFEASQSTEL